MDDVFLDNINKNLAKITNNQQKKISKFRELNLAITTKLFVQRKQHIF